MKTSPNREQQLFLVAGGTILVLILGVVIFNMIQPPGKVTKEEKLTPRPVVVLNGDANRPSTAREGSPWLSSVSPAAIFTNSKKPGANSKKPDDDLESEAVTNRRILKPGERPSPQGVGNVEQVGEKWSPNAGNVESSRLATAPERKQPLKLKVPKVDPGKISQKSKPPPKPARVAKKPVAKKPAAKKPVTVARVAKKPVAKKPPAKKPAAKKPPVRIMTGKPATATKKSKRPPAAPNKGYPVQVASFSNPNNAKALAQRLGALKFEGARLPVYRSDVTVRGKTYYRVRVGPFSDRGQAKRATDFIRRMANLNGKVMSFGR